MNIKKLILLSLVSFSLISQIGCSSSTNTTSGTGVGNPGKTTVSFVSRSYTNKDQTDSFSVVGGDGLNFTIKSAFITAEKIYFNHEGGSILKEGPYKFNAFNGEAEPIINFNDLPDNVYTGLDFIVEIKDNVNDFYSVELNGTFIYNSQLRNFSMKLNIKGNQKDKYSLEEGPSQLNFNTINIFKIDLEVDGWLNNIYLKNYLDNETLTFEQNGDLIIDEYSDWKAAKEIAKDVKKNIFKSGKLHLIFQ